MVVGQSDFSLRAAAEALPLHDAFAVLFFVSIGMLFQPAYFLAAPGFVFATLGLVLLLKPLVALVIVLALGYPLRCGLAVSVVLGQIGEFSFILAEVGRKLGILDDHATNTFVVAAIVSISINPILYRLVDKIEDRAKRRPGLSRWLIDRRRVGANQPATGATVASDESSRARDRVSRRRRRVWAGRPNGGAAAPRKLGRADDHRAEPGDGAAASRRESRPSTATRRGPSR